MKKIYGPADASSTWHTHLKKVLMDFKFKQSQGDPCLFFKGSLFFILYVNDGVVLCPEKANADALIDDLKQRGYILSELGPLAVYLGLQVERLPGNLIFMKQPAFIDRIIDQCGLKDQRLHDTPVDTIYLNKTWCVRCFEMFKNWKIVNVQLNMGYYIYRYLDLNYLWLFD